MKKFGSRHSLNVGMAARVNESFGGDDAQTVESEVFNGFNRDGAERKNAEIFKKFKVCVRG